MSKYRRIEISAYQRRVTVVSGEWRPGEIFDAQPTQTDDGVSLTDPDSSEAIAPDSPEGQTILIEAVRTLQRRLLPESRAALREPSKDLDADSKESISLLRKDNDHETDSFSRQENNQVAPHAEFDCGTNSHWHARVRRNANSAGPGPKIF